MDKLASAIYYLIIISLLAHPIGESLPRSWFSPSRFPFKEYKWEKNTRLYERLRVSAWKDDVPDMSKRCKNMLPKAINAKVRSQDIHALIIETCVAELVHYVLSLLSFVVLSILQNVMGAVICLIYILLGNLPFILIQRYNRPRLTRLYERLRLREEKLNHENTDPKL